MNTYRYKAVSRDGANVNGVIEAYDEFEAVARIKQDCSIVLKVEQVLQKRGRIDLNEPLWVSEKVLSLTSSQFAILLRAGLPMVRTVEIIAQQTTDRLMRKILTQVTQDVAAGYSLARSFETRGKKIPLTFIETIRAGEESGTLEQCFAKLEKYYAKSYKTKSKVRSALMYPAFLCVLAVIVIAVVMAVTMPVITTMYSNFDGDLPLITRILIAMTNFFKRFWWLVAAAVCLAIAGVRIYGKSEQGRIRFSNWAMRLPVLGRINIMKGASQFANTLSTLLTAGLPMTNAIQTASRVIDNYALGLSVASAVPGLEEGKQLGDLLKANPYLPPLLTEMTGVGEESGSLEDTLDTIGAYYDNEVETSTAKLLSMLEPVITVIMGIVIGFIIIGLYIPMFGMYGGIG